MLFVTAGSVMIPFCLNKMKRVRNIPRPVIVAKVQAFVFFVNERMTQADDSYGTFFSPKRKHTTVYELKTVLRVDTEIKEGTSKSIECKIANLQKFDCSKPNHNRCLSN